MNREFFKWMVSGDSRGILGINRRNIDYIYTGSSRKFFRLADRKLETKKILEKAGLPFPETLGIFTEFREIVDFETISGEWKNFVIKPDRGKMGSGIMVLGERSDSGFWDTDGNEIVHSKIRKRLGDIILGVYSNGLNDIAFIEERIYPHHFFSDLYPRGLSDIRIITYRKEPVMAMMRIPTGESGGRANLHQGGVGVAVEISSGLTYAASIKRGKIEKHPDTGAGLVGKKIPFFKDMLRMCGMLPDDIRLNYLGFDFAVDRERGPLILEINARPGLEIQNIGNAGLHGLLRERAGGAQ